MKPAGSAALNDEEKAVLLMLTGFVERLNEASGHLSKDQSNEGYTRGAIAASLLVIAKMMVFSKADELNLRSRMPALK